MGARSLGVRGSLRTRRSEILLDLGRPHDAERAAATAEAVIADEQGAQVGSDQLGEAQLALGAARVAPGKPGEAMASLQAAVHHLRSALGDGHGTTRRARMLLEGRPPSSSQ